MRYYEKFKEHDVDSGFGLLVFGLMNLVLSPYRLLSTISHKVLFLGDYINTLFFLSTSLNLVLLVVTFIYQWVFIGGLYLVDGIFPIVSLIVSLILNGVCYYFTSLYKYDVNFDNIKDLEKEVSVDLHVPTPVNTGLNKDPEEVSDVLSERDRKELIINESIQAIDDNIIELDIDNEAYTQAESSMAPDQFVKDGDNIAKPKRSRMGAGILEYVKEVSSMNADIDSHAMEFHSGNDFINKTVESDYEEQEEMFGDF